MNKEKEAMLERLKNVKQTSESYLKENNFENYVVKNVIHYNKKVQLVNKETNKKEEFDLYAVIAENTNPEKDGEKIFELEYLENKEGKIFTISDLIKEYEGFENIKDVVDKTKENEEKPEEEQDKELKKDNLEELEAEKDQEEKGKTKNSDKEKDDKEEITLKKKKKPSYVIERVNPDKAKMDYWQTVKQACGLPPKVETLAFAYPVSSEDKVDYANITVYMLDKDGYIIDDLDVDDYFEFDSTTGNNPMQDNVVRHEEDENKGKTQLDSHNTMTRLFAKNSSNRNTYISLEQKNNFGDYNDINAGRKAVAGTQNVEKQLETDRVRVWDSEREKLIKSNAGKYNINDIFDEAKKHKEHGEEYTDIENADGEETTIEICESSIIPGTDKTWEELSEQTGEGVTKLQERFKREFEKGKKPEVIIEEIEDDYEMINREHNY